MQQSAATSGICHGETLYSVLYMYIQQLLDIMYFQSYYRFLWKISIAADGL